MSHKFTFYGDSWFWGWNQQDHNEVKSQELRKYKGSFDENGITHEHYKGIEHQRSLRNPQQIQPQYTEAYNWLGILLDALGYKYNVFNIPGNSFQTTTESFELSIQKILTGEHAEPEWHVIFYSLPIRDNELEKLLFSGKNNSQIQHELDTIKEQCLLKIGQLAHQHNQKVIIAGGHSVLHRKFINMIPPEMQNHIHLLTPCISSALKPGQDPNQPVYGEFKLAGGFTGKDYIQNAHPSVINRIHGEVEAHQIAKGDGIANYHNWINFFPDSGHLGAIGHFKFLDMLFKYIEDHK